MPWTHGNLTEGPADSRKVDKCLQKVPWMHGKLTGLLAARKVDGNFKEGPIGARNVDGKSLGHT